MNVELDRMSRISVDEHQDTGCCIIGAGVHANEGARGSLDGTMQCRAVQLSRTPLESVVWPENSLVARGVIS